MADRCRSCGADIVWARTINDILMPVDADPHPDGNCELDGRGRVIVHAQPDLLGGERHMPHHATCPQADDWRSRG